MQVRVMATSMESQFDKLENTAGAQVEHTICSLISMVLFQPLLNLELFGMIASKGIRVRGPCCAKATELNN